MPRIACLHTAPTNIAIFDAALRASGRTDVRLHHHVRADLLAAAEQAGHVTPAVAAATVEALHALGANADAVLLTCSTLGPIAEDAGVASVFRVDAALAREAVRQGGRVTVLCAVETTLAPTRQLFEREARATGAAITVQLVPDAWAAFKAGDTGRYLTLIAGAAEAARRGGATQVALAQASMAPAADLVPPGLRPLDSPATALAAAAA